MEDKTNYSELQSKVEQLMETTKVSQEIASVVLHDCEFDLQRSVNYIFEGEHETAGDDWTQVAKPSKQKAVKAKDSRDGRNADNSKPNQRKFPSETNNNHQNGTESTRGRGGLGGRGRGRGGNQFNSDRPPRDSKREDSRDDRPPRRDADNNGSSGEFKDGREFSKGPRRGTGERGRGSRGDRPGRGSVTREGGTGKEFFRGKDGFRSERGRGSDRGDRPRGTREFRPTKENQPPADDDTFASAIDTWTPTDGKPATVAPEKLTVGQWSDTLIQPDRDDDCSEDNYVLGKGPVVFESSCKPLIEKDEELPKSSTQRTPISGTAFIHGGHQNSTPVAVAPPQNLAAAYVNQDYARSATDALKNLVGISSAPRGQPAPVQTQQPRPSSEQKRDRDRQRRSTKIPEQAVEMPTNDGVSSLNVQFGALGMEFGNIPAPGYEGHKTGAPGLRDASPLNPYRPQGLESQNQKSQGQSSDILSLKNIASQQEAERVKMANEAKHIASDLYAARAQPVDLSYNRTQPSYANQSNPQQQSYGGAGNYASVAATTAQYHSYSANQGSYAGAPGYTPYQSSGSTPNKNLNALSEALGTASPKNPSQSYGSDLHGNNTTQTTNVLGKNSLSATGKSVPGVSTAPNSSQHQQVAQQLQNMVGPQYIMSSPHGFAYGMYDPNQQMLAGGHRGDGQPFGYPTSDNKYGARQGEPSDIGSSGGANVSSASGAGQVPVSQAHGGPYIGHLPPGYMPGAFFYAPMPQGALAYPPANPVFPAASASGPNAAGFGPKAGAGYGQSHYNAYDPSALQDYKNYGQSGVGGQAAKSGLGSTGDLMNNQSAYNKTHSQLNKSYDNKAYLGAQPAPFNSTLGQAYGQSQYMMMPQTTTMLPMGHGALQGDASSGGSAPGAPGLAGNAGQQGRAAQGPAGGQANKNNYTNYGQNRW